MARIYPVFEKHRTNLSFKYPLSIHDWNLHPFNPVPHPRRKCPHTKTTKPIPNSTSTTPPNTQLSTLFPGNKDTPSKNIRFVRASFWISRFFLSFFFLINTRIHVENKILEYLTLYLKRRGVRFDKIEITSKEGKEKGRVNGHLESTARDQSEPSCSKMASKRGGGSTWLLGSGYRIIPGWMG